MSVLHSSFSLAHVKEMMHEYEKEVEKYERNGREINQGTTMSGGVVATVAGGSTENSTEGAPSPEAMLAVENRSVGTEEDESIRDESRDRRVLSILSRVTGTHRNTDGDLFSELHGSDNDCVDDSASPTGIAEATGGAVVEEVIASGNASGSTVGTNGNSTVVCSEAAGTDRNRSTEEGEVAAGGGIVERQTERVEGDVMMGLSEWSHWNSRKMMKCVLADGGPRPLKESRKYFGQDTLRETVRYVLQSTNVHLLSWGTRRLLVNGVPTRFPVLVRKVSVNVMWRNYSSSECAYPSDVKKVRRTFFCLIVKKLTRGDVKQRASIDYKLHGLVYENAATLRRLIDDHARQKEERRELKKKLRAVCEFLKYSYITHLDEASSDPFHNIKYGLGHGTFTDKVQRGECSECNAVFTFLGEVKQAMTGVPAQMNEVLSQAADKFELFMGHIIRKHVQDREIE